MFLHDSKNWGSVPTCTTEEDDHDEIVASNTLGMQYATPHLLPRFDRAGRNTTTRFSATLLSPSLTLKARPLCQRGITRLQHRSLLCTEMGACLWPGFPTSHRRKGLKQAHEDCS